MFKMRLEIERGKDPPFSPTAMTVFVFITKELEGQRAPFLPNMMNGFFINHNEPDDGPKAFSGCSRLRGGGGRLRGAVLDLNRQRKFPGFFWSNLISGCYRKYLAGRESTDLGRKKAEKRATSPGEARREMADLGTQRTQPAEKRTRRPVPTPLQHAMRLG